jgi:hypothetical protein
MDALTTARAVLQWCVYPVGSPPRGSLGQAHRLADPDAATRDALAAIARATAARSGAGPVPLGDGSPVGLASILLAAFVGGRSERDVAARILDAAPRLRLGRRDAGWADGLTRHGVVAATTSRSAGADPGLVEALLAASPLSNALLRPATDAEDAAFSAAMRLLDRPHGRAVLTAAFATPEPDPAVLTWRGKLLDHLRQERADIMLDIYTAARLWHGPDWDDLLAQARRDLLGRGRPSDLAIAALRYWLPLDTVHSRELEQRTLAAIIASRGEDPLVPAVGHTLEGRPLLRYEDYGPVVRMVTRYRSSLLLGGS